MLWINRNIFKSFTNSMNRTTENNKRRLIPGSEVSVIMYRSSWTKSLTSGNNPLKRRLRTVSDSDVKWLWIIYPMSITCTFNKTSSKLPFSSLPTLYLNLNFWNRWVGLRDSIYRPNLGLTTCNILWLIPIAIITF